MTIYIYTIFQRAQHDSIQWMRGAKKEPSKRKSDIKWNENSELSWFKRKIMKANVVAWDHKNFDLLHKNPFNSASLQNLWRSLFTCAPPCHPPSHTYSVLVSIKLDKLLIYLPHVRFINFCSEEKERELARRLSKRDKNGHTFLLLTERRLRESLQFACLLFCRRWMLGSSMISVVWASINSARIYGRCVRPRSCTRGRLPKSCTIWLWLYFQRKQAKFWLKAREERSSVTN